MVLSGEITAQIRQVLEKHPEGISITDLVKSVDVNRNTAGRYLENLLLSGQVEMRRFGMAKMYTLTKRLPVSSVLSLSSELVMQLDNGQRVFYANDPLLTFLGTPAKDLFGKNIEFTPFSIVFENVFTELLDRFRNGLRGEGWQGELSRPVRERFFFCRITPTVSNEGKKGVSVILEDISDRKRDEERIRQSEERLRSIFRVSPVGIGVIADRILLEVNDRFCEITGYSSAEIVGRSARILYLSDDTFRNVGILYTRQIRQNGTSTLETQWLKKDGTVIDILLNTTPLDPANISGGITFTALDITERKRSEQNLRESEAKLQLALSGSEMGMWEIYIPSMKGLIDERAAAILGYQKSTIGPVQSDWDALSHPDDVPLIHQRLSDYLEGRTSIFESEHRVRHASGRWIWVLGRGKITHRSTDGSCTRISGTMQDITARKQAEEALRESEEKYRHLVEQSLQGLTILQNGRSVFANSAMMEISGYAYEEYLALSPEEMMATVYPDDRHRIAQVMADRLKGKNTPAEHEFRILRKDGETRWVLTHGTLITYHGTPAIQSACFDITGRKKAEEALTENEERYRKLVEISPNAILLHRDRKIIYANQALARILGIEKADDLLGREVMDLIHPAFREVIRTNIVKDLSGMTSPFMELQMVRADGTPVEVEGQGVATTIDGRPAVLVAVNDTTEQRKARISLKESEERYRILSEASQDIIYLVGRDDRVEYVNSCAAAILGLAADQVSGKKRSSLFSGHLGERQAQGLRRVFETGKTMRSEGAMEIFGTMHWFDHSLMPVTDAQGRVTSVLGVSRDITARKQAEDALRVSEERFRFLLEQTFDAVAIHKDKKIVSLNERAAQILGAATPGDLAGRPIFDLIHPDSARDLEERIQMMAADPTKPAPVLREKFIRVDGTTVTVEVMAIQITDNGLPATKVMFREIAAPEPE
jgi:PAS domain S-box-containing protein